MSYLLINDYAYRYILYLAYHSFFLDILARTYIYTHLFQLAYMYLARKDSYHMLFLHLLIEPIFNH